MQIAVYMVPLNKLIVVAVMLIVSNCHVKSAYLTDTSTL
jgi:hypothetical protein